MKPRTFRPTIEESIEVKAFTEAELNEVRYLVSNLCRNPRRRQQFFAILREEAVKVIEEQKENT